MCSAIHLQLHWINNYLPIIIIHLLFINSNAHIWLVSILGLIIFLTWAKIQVPNFHYKNWSGFVSTISQWVAVRWRALPASWGVLRLMWNVRTQFLSSCYSNQNTSSSWSHVTCEYCNKNKLYKVLDAACKLGGTVPFE